MSKIKWPDLSEYGVSLLRIVMPDKTFRLILQNGGRCPDKAKSLGFRLSAAGVWARHLDGFNIKSLRAIFPKMAIVEREQSEFTRVIGSVKPRYSPVGKNYLGTDIFEDETGRFYLEPGSVAPSNPVRYEADRSGYFLRVTDGTSLQQCATAAVNQMKAGRHFNDEDFRAFLSMVYTNTETASDGDEAVKLSDEIVIQTAAYFAENNHQADLDAYRNAVSLYEKQPPAARTQDSNFPIPLAIAAFHALDRNDAESLEHDGVLLAISGGRSASLACAALSGLNGVSVAHISGHESVKPGSDHKDVTSVRNVADLDRQPDVTFSIVKSGQMEHRVTVSGMSTNRSEHAIIAGTLNHRDPEGRSIFVIDGYVNLADDGENARFLSWLATAYHIDGIAEMDASIYSRDRQSQGGHVRSTVIAVGKRDGNGTVPEINQIFDYAQLWNWSDVTLEENREKHLAEDKRKVRDRVSSSTLIQNNEYQSPYVPASRVSTPECMIPKNLVGPTREALARIENTYGNIDDFVARELGWTIGEMAQYISAEQVDAVAMSIHSLKIGRAPIEGDQTGMGKGRVLAAMARWSVLNGNRAFFITESPSLFTDFWRDISDIGSAGLFKPFLVNNNEKIFNQNGDVIFESDSKDIQASAFVSGILPDGRNLILASYSQFNRKKDQSPKADFLANIASECTLLLDESHNAGGVSNIAKNLISAVVNANKVVYASATFAKNADNLPIYFRAFPQGIDIHSIQASLQKGGEMMQETLSRMLAEDGVLIRREPDIAKVAFHAVEDVSRRSRNRDLSGDLAKILETMGVISNEVTAFTNKVAAKAMATAKSAKGTPASRGASAFGKNKLNMMGSNIGSNLYMLMRQFLLCAKAEHAADLAIDALKKGQKPVVMLENTMESLFRNALDERLEQMLLDNNVDLSGLTTRGKTQHLNDLEIDPSTGIMFYSPITFRDVLYRVADRICPTDEPSLNMDEARAELHGMIAQFPDMTVSPMDIIRQRLESEGFVVGELSGRTHIISDIGGMDGNPPGAQMVRRAKKSAPVGVINAFNAGLVDAIIATRTTGYSIHASEKFEDQRQRVMIMLQPSGDPAKLMQSLGRVGRKGQVVPPEVVTPLTGLPAEDRENSLTNQKLRKMSANITGNRDNSIVMKDVVDLINRVGNQVCLEFMQEHPDLAKRMGVDISDHEVDARKYDHSWFANKSTSRLVMLHPDEQDVIISELESNYITTLRDLDAKGNNPLAMKEYDFRARIIKRDLFHGVEMDEYPDAFSTPVHMIVAEYDKEIRPVRSDIIDIEAKHYEEAFRKDFRINDNPDEPYMDGFIRAIEKQREPMLKNMLDTQQNLFTSVEDAINSPDANMIKRNAGRFLYLTEVLKELKQGAAIQFTNFEGEVATGIVVINQLPKAGHESFPGQYSLKVYTAGEQYPQWSTLHSFREDEAFKVLPDSMIETVKEKINSVKTGSVTERRIILVGNMFTASEMSANARTGMNAIFTDQHGVRHRGIVMPAGISLNSLDIPVKLSSSDMASSLLSAHDNIKVMENPVYRSDQDVMIWKGVRAHHITCPSSRSYGARIFEDKVVLGLVDAFVGGTGKTITAKFKPESIAPLMNRLYEIGSVFYAESNCRDWSNKFLADKLLSDPKNQPQIEQPEPEESLQKAAA